MENKQIFQIVKSFNVMEWLLFIKTMTGISEEELLEYGIDAQDLYILKNTNWHSIVLDLTLRLSPYHTKNTIKINNHKMILGYIKLVVNYINYYDDTKKHKENLSHSLYETMSIVMHDQLRNISPEVNSLGRLILLYNPQKNLFKQEFGLTPKQILYFYQAVQLVPNNSPLISRNFILKVFHRHGMNISEKNIIKFFDCFSVSIKDYRLKAKESGITKSAIRNKRLVMEYPIIRYSDLLYMVPSIYVLLESLSYKIFNKINTTDNRIRAFGDTFENYIRDMSKYFHKNYFHECTDLIKEGKKGNKKAEFYLKNDELSLVIEAKVLHINDAIVSSTDIESIEKKFKNTVDLEQLNSCSKKLPNMYSLIIVHKHIPAINAFVEPLVKKSSNKYNWLNRMALITVIDYENLISLPLNEIIARIKKLQDPLFRIIPRRENEYLINEYNKYVYPQNTEQVPSS